MKKFSFKKCSLAFLLIGAIVFTSCTKKPVACLTTDKDVYRDGETMHLTSCSTDAASYEWTISDNLYYSKTYTTQNADLVLDYYSQSFYSTTGQLTINLHVKSKNGNHSDDAKKVVDILPPTGQVVFYNPYYQTPVTIIDNHGSTVGTLNTLVSSATCGAAGLVTLTLEQGSYQYSFETTGVSNYVNFTVNGNSCTQVATY
jgi:hypothetical protein